MPVPAHLSAPRPKGAQTGSTEPRGKVCAGGPVPVEVNGLSGTGVCGLAVDRVD